MTVVSREREAGRLYTDGLNAVKAGGLQLHSLAMHLILMIKGTGDFPGPLWPVREMHDGTVRRLDRFIDYLLRQARDGLNLPNLYFLKQALEATPKDGERALVLVRTELAKEHVDFDEQARKDELKLHSERKGLNDQGTNQHTRGDDNIISSQQGTSAAYLAARLKRDFPEISERLARGEFRSVRAAAIKAGIITPPTPLEQIQKLWAKLDQTGREEHRKWTLNHCATCGQPGTWEDGEPDGMWCDNCCEEGARQGVT